MKKTPLLLGVALAALTLASCEKELDKVHSSPQSSAAALALARPALLTTGAWRQTGLTISATDEATNQVTTSDLFPYTKPSMLVTSATYKADGTYSLLRGVRSNGEASTPIDGTWRLTATADSLIETQADYTRRFAVTELTDKTLRLTYSEPNANGKATVSTSVFSH
ncbi:hypothetical protein I2I05_06040 [Hymenobacter sp. BT683]|uniref:DUF5004 domain-containing protein n=1 Tax=Hymenobacter jeongseonensis TaxID=2791027 RepID=A0ABS0IF57_9BACT|nr:hypothetical protein [Hymenobacter jeongseonensis]MBF9236950.1 hypothetical protein [Hymenobacter jeongseonensis]